MGNGRGGGKEGLAPLLVDGHARGHLVELVKFLDPEELINIDIARIALGGLGVVGEEVQLCGAVFGMEDNGVAREIDIEVLTGDGHDIPPEHLGLGPGGGEKDLVPSREHGVFEGLLGEVPGGPDLAGF